MNLKELIPQYCKCPIANLILKKSIITIPSIVITVDSKFEPISNIIKDELKYITELTSLNFELVFK